MNFIEPPKFTPDDVFMAWGKIEPGDALIYYRDPGRMLVSKAELSARRAMLEAALALGGASLHLKRIGDALCYIAVRPVRGRLAA